MKKLDLEAKRRERNRKGEILKTTYFHSPEQVEAIEDLSDRIQQLHDYFLEKEEYDFTELETLLKDIGHIKDISTYIKSLEEAIKINQNQISTNTKSLILKQTDSFSKLLEVVKAIDFKPSINVKANDVSGEYKASDAEPGSPTSYYGFLHPSGKWYIMRQSGNVNASFRYIAGDSQYQASWQKKSNLQYKLYSEVKL